MEVSLTLLDSLHDRWVRLLRSLQPEDWKRTFRHPELGLVSLEKNLALYAWHGRHHVAHITACGRETAGKGGLREVARPLSSRAKRGTLVSWSAATTPIGKGKTRIPRFARMTICDGEFAVGLVTK